MKTKRSFIEIVQENGNVLEVSLIKNKIDIQVYKRTKKPDELFLSFDTSFTKGEAKELIEVLQELINE